MYLNVQFITHYITYLTGGEFCSMKDKLTTMLRTTIFIYFLQRYFMNEDGDIGSDLIKKYVIVSYYNILL